MSANSTVRTAVPREGGSRRARGFLFDQLGEDRAIDLDELSAQSLNDRRLLWIDLDTSNQDILDIVPASFAFDEHLSSAIGDGGRTPLLRDLADRLRVRLLVPERGGGEPITLDCVAADNWVVTAHAGALDLLDRFVEPLDGETDLGRLPAARFLVLLLDAVVDRYFEWIDELEEQIDQFDERVIGADADVSHEPPLAKLVSLRHSVQQLRRTLGLHRHVFARLEAPEFQKLTTPEAAARFHDVAVRLDRAVDGADTAREMVIESFNIVATHAAQRTNNIMKRLTIISAVLLPGVVLAGILGMNFHPSFFDRPEYFGVAVGLMATLALGILAAGRWRHWY